MDAERAVPSERALVGLGAQYEHQLGGKFCGWPHLPADDGVLDAGVDLSYILLCMYWRVSFDLVDIPGNERTESRGGGCLACGRLGREIGVSNAAGKILD